MKSLVKQSMVGLRVLLVLTVLTGIIYPLVVWGVSRVPGLQANAEGSIITVNGQAVGSKLIGIDPGDPAAMNNPNDPWFHTRPAAAKDDDGNWIPFGTGDPSASGGSNLGADNDALVQLIAARKAAIAQREGVNPDQVPPDAVTASASGLDPQISPAYAELQTARVARVNGLSVDEVRKLVAENTVGRGLGVLGEPGVNVLQLNLAIQAAKR